MSRSGWGSGVCVGDVANSGLDDLYVTYWGRKLSSVIRHGVFKDIAAASGVEGDGKTWSFRVHLPRLRSRRPPGFPGNELPGVQPRVHTTARQEFQLRDGKVCLCSADPEGCRTAR